MTKSASPDLGVELCGLRLAGPLLLGSGGLGESADSLAPFQAVTSAVVTRTLRLNLSEARAIFPSPHLALGPRRTWLMNSEWGNQRTVDYWLSEGLPQAMRGGPVIISVSGRDIDDCIATCKRLDGMTSLFEVNVSCSHAGLVYGRISDDVAHVARLASALKLSISTPFIIKLGWSPTLPEVARAAVAAGADCIAVTNSVGPGLDLSLPSGRPRLGISGGAGGLSGPAIFPLALECVREVVETVDVPVVGVGGIRSHADVVKMLLVGATCVQVYTSAFLYGPRVLEKINEGLVDYMARYGHRDLGSLRGNSLPYLRRESNLRPIIPVIDETRCHPCGQCVDICPHGAIALDSVAVMDDARCTGCGICVDACPPGYSAISLPKWSEAKYQPSDRYD